MNLTTHQVKLGLMIQTSTGYSFFPLWLAMVYALAFIAGVMARLTVDVWQVYRAASVAVVGGAQHHLMILGLGVQVIWGQVDYAIRN
jgi:hypothetical protein